MATPIPQNQAGFSLDEIARATGGRLEGPAASTQGVVIDSRAVTPCSLFVALRGERFDGHRFAADVVEAGAGALVVAEDAELTPSRAPRVRVADTTRALGDLAAMHRGRWAGNVIGVTGSAGKTSTKELVAAALEACGAAVSKTRGNLNNLVGVPMTLFCLGDAHDTAVVEMGTSERGEIRRLGEIGRPDIAVVTLVSAAHTEGLGTVDDVAREKASLVDTLPIGGKAVVDGDDPHLVALAEAAAPGRVLRFGRDEACDVRLVSFSFDRDLRTVAVYDVRGVGRVEATLSLLGEPAARNGAAALAVVLARGLDVREALSGLAAVAPTPGRLCPTTGGPFVILDDSYNANPRSTVLAIQTAAAFAEARGVSFGVVLGDMLELGDRSADEHAGIGRIAMAEGARGAVFVGAEMLAAAEAARELGRDRVRHVTEAPAAIAPIRELCRPGDVVLVKGSRSMKTEVVVAALSRAAGPEVAS
ncbi:MAG: UDP-N-acetylmuramoyl-tripeptide--D-alanyl-D-alanine ligase [Deltaproteobacteria bacterium]|nr:UDP-N-acetylmuramoyl-tripeptide--D-alanyl-D-alanine ligase [Deltaproteobacteria bacterium]